MPAVVARVKTLRERLEQAERNPVIQESEDDRDEDENGFEPAFFDDVGDDDSNDERAASDARAALLGIGITEEKVQQAIDNVLREMTARQPPKTTGGKQKQPSRPPLVDLVLRIINEPTAAATATEKRTGLVKSVTIDTAGQHRINLDAARTNLAALFAEQEPARGAFLPDDGDDFEDNDSAVEIIEVEAIDDSASLLASARSLRNRAKKLLESGVAESDAAAIRARLAEVAPAIEARDWRGLRETLDTLSGLLFYLDD